MSLFCNLFSSYFLFCSYNLLFSSNYLCSAFLFDSSNLRFYYIFLSSSILLNSSSFLACYFFFFSSSCKINDDLFFSSWFSDITSYFFCGIIPKAKASPITPIFELFSTPNNFANLSLLYPYIIFIQAAANPPALSVKFHYAPTGSPLSVFLLYWIERVDVWVTCLIIERLTLATSVLGFGILSIVLKGVDEGGLI